jgi:aspartate carbamoyltransferase catalytic subunit
VNRFNLNHIYESQQFDRPLLEYLFNVADTMKADLSTRPRKYAEVLKDKIMASLFYEPSTRTRFSFESAMTRLGGRIITTENAKEFSSAAKGETIYDTIRVMNGYVDIIILRHNEPGAAKKAAEVSSVPVINAGDGAGQHPTQALLDLYTIKDNLGRIDGLSIAMVGDLKYGRTVRSLSYLLTKFDAIQIYYVAPPVCRMDDDIKEYLDRNQVKWKEKEHLEKVLADVDCVYMTRVQRERFHDPEDYKQVAGKYILNKEKARLMNMNAIIMHPLPRVDEIPPDMDQDPRSRYFEQAKNGLYIRMALLYLLLTE